MPRAYRSPLRREAALQTRIAIADAASELITDGRLEVPAVALRAGVSLPTVYTHYPSKESLIEEITASTGLVLAGLADRLPGMQPRAVRLLNGIRGVVAAHEAEAELVWAAHLMAPASLAMAGLVIRVRQAVEDIASVLTREAVATQTQERGGVLQSTVAGLLNPLTFRGMRQGGMTANQVEQHLVGSVTRLLATG